MKCPLCLKEKKMIHTHHTRPISTGGENHPTIDICGECHDAIHTCATKIISGKGHEATDISKNTFKDNKLAITLIKSIVRYRLLKKDGKIPDDNLEFKIILTFPAVVRRYIEVLSKDSKLSMVNYITQLVTNHIKKKFPGQKYE